ncbi:hypothetical protein BDU57DRAFT_551268 [Ampelomyces quisqualis]|uniref:Uncharacterized protein n=1 Tax=Ampelomyces quisqualis TaxID=50730 RepID=A0A6A5QAK6_AMPQU|nr:hypothetical protein BDU57DRAFT_551268 [Ampelomyces quisqualis]
MAPHKPAADNESKEIAHTKKNKDKVAKRPARGYHRFKNGMLNVAPKGQEKGLVATNGVSILLALPAEIRSQIFHYALGGKTFRQIYKSWNRRPFQCEPSEHIHAFALLQTCRQIYVETAAVPFASNAFTVDDCSMLKNSCRPFTKYQIRNIKELQIELPNVLLSAPPDPSLARKFRAHYLAYLPELRRIRVLVFPRDPSVGNEEAFARYVAYGNAEVEDRAKKGGLELIYELMHVKYSKSYKT